MDLVCEITLSETSSSHASTPTKIIWCYGQWQSSYSETLNRMQGIDFSKGISDDVDEYDYLDVSTRNLIVLNDLCRSPVKAAGLLIPLRRKSL